jgi:hypothetical protein
LGSLHRYGVDTRLGLPRRLSTGEVGRYVSEAFAGERLVMVLPRSKVLGTGSCGRKNSCLPVAGSSVGGMHPR